MAEIQLKSNWSGYTPGSIVTVSDARGKYLVDELKVARYTQGQIEADKAKAEAEDADSEKKGSKAKTSSKSAAKK